MGDCSKCGCFCYKEKVFQYIQKESKLERIGMCMPEYPAVFKISLQFFDLKQKLSYGSRKNIQKRGIFGKTPGNTGYLKEDPGKKS